RGHSGYDYAYGQGTNIIAAADGALYVPAVDVVNDPGGNDPWCSFHTFYINHGSGWTTWYLHSAQLSVGSFGSTEHAQCQNGVHSNITADQFVAQVHKGDVLATVGNFAYGKVGGVGYHLHFEVRRGCDISAGAAKNCM